MPSIGFHDPQYLALLALLPLAWRYLTVRRWQPSTYLRIVLAALAAVLLARPHLNLPDPGSDVIVLIDRSASCETDTRPAARELVPLLERTGSAHDRVAVIGFARGAAVERPFGRRGDSEGILALDSDASDIASALRLATQLRQPTRRTAVLVLSDGLHTGENPLSDEVLAELVGMPVWHRHYSRIYGPDAAAGAITVPDVAEPRSAWVVRYAIHANAPMRVDYLLSRPGIELAQGTADLAPGVNHFFVRDTADEPGVLEYRLDVKADPDAIPGNNSSTAVLRIEGAPRVLLVQAADEPGLLASALEAAFIPVDRIAPHEFPSAPALLAPYKVVILENCRLTEFPSDGVGALAEAVESGLCALLVTGGPNSFATGGYHRSRLDPLLPVEMELRNDKRRNLMALAIALDRSGSMGMPVGDGRVKMDLANLGAAEAIRMLGPLDQVSVIAVDTNAHIIVPMSRADDTSALVAATMRIQSMGGGIYCYTAMKAAVQELEKSPLPNRSIVLFADANDADEQEGCVALAASLLARGIGTSVIGMGSERDVHAGFLKELARAGGGEALFSDRIHDLPMLFTQEVARMSQRGFTAETVVPEWLPAAGGLGPPPGAAGISIDGYNVSFLREGAIALAVLDDEFATPIVAVRTKGRAVTGAALFETDGEYSGAFAHWAGAPGFWAALVRRLAAGVNRTAARAYTAMEPGLASVEVEFTREVANRLRGRELPAEWLGPGGETVAARVEWSGPRRVRLWTILTRPGHYLPTVDLGEDGVLAAAAVSVPYSPEFAQREGVAGAALLAELGRATGGGTAADFGAVRQSATRLRDGSRELRSLLLVVWCLLFALEVSGRRLAWFR